MEAHGGDVRHPSSCSWGVVNLGVCIEGQNISLRLALPRQGESQRSTPEATAEASLPPLGPQWTDAHGFLRVGESGCKVAFSLQICLWMRPFPVSPGLLPSLPPCNKIESSFQDI